MTIGASLGSTPFGVGTPATAAAPPSTPPVGAAFIDYRTRNYVVSTAGELARMPITRQRVLLAISTALGSSTVLRNAGTSFPVRIDDSYEKRCTQAVQTALAFLTPNEIVLQGVSVDTTSIIGRVQIEVSYVDLATGEPDQVKTLV